MWPEDNAGMSVCNTGAPPNFGLSNIIDGLILAAHGCGGGYNESFTMDMS